MMHMMATRSGLKKKQDRLLTRANFCYCHITVLLLLLLLLLSASGQSNYNNSSASALCVCVERTVERPSERIAMQAPSAMTNGQAERLALASAAPADASNGIVGATRCLSLVHCNDCSSLHQLQTLVRLAR